MSSSPTLERLDCRKLPLAPGSSEEVAVPPILEALDRDTHASWGGGLTMEQYLRRERVLRGTAFSRQGLWTWVLRDGDAVLASCESYEAAVTMAGRSRPGLGHGIASVYVAPDRRGHGHAGELLRRLHDALRGEGVDLCFLFSEIGPTLYQRLGYVGRPLSLRRYAAARGESHGPTPPWRLLTEAEVAAALATRKLPARALQIAASPAHVQWHLRRARFYAAALGRPLPRHVGALDDRGDALCLWAPDYRHDVLRVLTLYPGARLAAPGSVFDGRSPEGERLRNVLHAGRTVAAELGLAAIELWENPVNSAYLRGGVQAPCADLPMVLMLRPDQTAPPARADDWLDYERAHWL